MNDATRLEVMAELAGVLAETNHILYLVCHQVGFESSAQTADRLAERSRDIQHHLQREAGLYEARENTDPWDAA